MLQLMKKTIYLIYLMFLVLFIGSSFFIRAKYNSFIYGDTPVLQQQKPFIFILFVFIAALLGVIFYRACLKLNKYNKKIVIPLTLFLTFLIQLGFIFTFTRLPTDDSKIVLSLALNMLYNKDYSSFNTSGYLHMFPFNFSTVLYLKSLLYLFPDNYLVIKIFNIIFSLITTLMIYLIYKQVNYRSRGNDFGVLIFAATYVPSIFMSNFIYNDTIATAFLTSSLYFAIRFVKEKSITYIIISAILLSIGNYFRNIGLIFLAAILIYVCLNWNKVGFKRVIIAFCLVITVINLPGLAQNAVLLKKNIITEPVNRNSAPIYMWLHMGINKESIGFWDCFKSYNIYKINGMYNKDISSRLFKEEIRNKLADASIKDLAVMYYKKLVWTWTEGTYQIERYGIGNDVSNDTTWRKRLLGGYIYKTFATDLFKGGSIFRSGLIWLLYAINFLIYCFIFVRMIFSIRANKYDEVLLVLVILGFIIFYLLWEIKSRYIYPVYPLLILLAYMGFKDFLDYITRISIIKKYRKGILREK